MVNERKFKRISKEVVVSKCQFYPGTCLEGLRRTTKIIRQNRCYFGLNLKETRSFELFNLDGEDGIRFIGGVIRTFEHNYDAAPINRLNNIFIVQVCVTVHH